MSLRDFDPEAYRRHWNCLDRAKLILCVLDHLGVDVSAETVKEIRPVIDALAEVKGVRGYIMHGDTSQEAIKAVAEWRRRQTAERHAPEETGGA